MCLLLVHRRKRNKERNEPQFEKSLQHRRTSEKEGRIKLNKEIFQYYCTIVRQPSLED